MVVNTPYTRWRQIPNEPPISSPAEWQVAFLRYGSKTLRSVSHISPKHNIPHRFSLLASTALRSILPRTTILEHKTRVSALQQSHLPHRNKNYQHYPRPYAVLSLYFCNSNRAPVVSFIRKWHPEPQEQYPHNLPSYLTLATAGTARLGFLIRARKSHLTAGHRTSPRKLPHLRNRA